jgi:hypothetical protein
MKTACYRQLYLFVLCLSLTSCVPYATTYRDPEILGRRINQLTKEETLIERRTKDTHIYCIIHPDGFGTDAYVSTYNYYLIKPDRTEKKLTHIAKKGLDSYLQNILPVDDSDMWVAFWLEENAVRKYFVDLNVIVFNESKVLHKNHIKDSIRTNTCNWESSDSYSIFPKNGNQLIKFKTKNGEVIYDVKTNSLNMGEER